MNKFYTQISKFLSYILRHNPEKFNIKLNHKGFAKLEDILNIVNKKFTTQKIDRNFIEKLIRHSDKRRFEIEENKIRAFYGHSFANKIEMPTIKHVPARLFHGTSLNAYQKIKKRGLKQRKRQYVHLSESIETAYFVGRRKTKKPIILIIDSKSAEKDGITFYKSGDMYLADYIPSKYISIYKENP